jgi:hypothetical protein
LKALALFCSSAIAATAMMVAPLAPATADTAPQGDTLATVSADSLPTAQIEEGVVWSQTIVGDTVFAGGEFSEARPPGAAPGEDTVTRANLLAYDINTGELKDFAPSINGAVLGVTASPDRSRLYIVGDFTEVNGASKFRIAALNPDTGELINSFNPGVNFRARTIVATEDTVYIGGGFTISQGSTRTRLAAFDADSGALLPWAPTADMEVMTMVLTPDKSKLVIGGQFMLVNGEDHFGMAALDPSSGVAVPWAATDLIRNAGPRAAISSLAVDDGTIYGTGFVNGKSGDIPKGNLEGVFAAGVDDGDVRWVADCHGDHYSTHAMKGVAYGVGHAHECDTIGSFPRTDPVEFHRALAFSGNARGTVQKTPHNNYFNFEGQPAPEPLHWWPTLPAGTFTGQEQAAWHVTGNDEYLLLGGEFLDVNGAGQQGLARFAVTKSAPNKVGPVRSGTGFKPSLTSRSSGTVRVGFKANWDMDSESLHYEIARDGDFNNPIYEKDISSTSWNLPKVAFTDTGLVPDQTHSYRLYASDSNGNRVAGDSVEIVASEGGITSPYASEVKNDDPEFFWRLGEESGTTAFDWANADDGTVGSGVSRGADGAIIDDENPASTFDGTTDGLVTTTALEPGPSEFSIETWARTTSTEGGKVVGFGSNKTADSSLYDRHIYMTDAGRIVFGTYPGVVSTIESQAGYNDGNWHHIVATLSSAGMKLFVDGEAVASDASVTTGRTYSGYWRVGGDNLKGWTSRPSSYFFGGDIDDVAVYSSVLSEQQVAKHYLLSGQDVPPPSPDTIAPNTRITSGPSGEVNSRGAKFSFTATEVGSTFECKLDSGSWQQCTSATSFWGLANGNHTFRVRASDRSRNTDSSPAVRKFTTAKRLSVKVAAVNSGSKLSVNLNPDNSSKNYKIKVQQKRKGNWKTIRVTYTKGSKDKRTINLGKGRYRVVARAQRDLIGATSKSVFLRR